MARQNDLMAQLGNRGVTLLEMLFASAGVGIVMAIVLTFWASSISAYGTNSARNASTGATSIGAEYIAKDLRNADAIISSYSGITTSANTIVISAPSYDAGGIIAGATDYIVYRAANSKLVRSVYPGQGSLRPSENSRRIANDVTNLQLTYIAHEYITADGGTTAFPLTTSWASTPTCRVDGVRTAVGYDSGSRTAAFSTAPPDGALVEFSYPVATISAQSLAAVSEVVVAVQSQLDQRDALDVTTSALLRNK